MYEATNIPFGSDNVTVKAETLRDYLWQSSMLHKLGRDAEFLEDFVRTMYDVEPQVVPAFRESEGNTYPGFICQKTRANLSFKEDRDGNIWPGRTSAFDNGKNNPKLYAPGVDFANVPQDFLDRWNVRPPNGNQQGNYQGGGRQQGGGQRPPQQQQGGQQGGGQRPQNGGGRGQGNGGGGGNRPPARPSGNGGGSNRPSSPPSGGGGNDGGEGPPNRPPAQPSEGQGQGQGQPPAPSR